MSSSKFLLFHLISLIIGSNYRTSSLDIPNISHSVCFLSAVNRTKTNITLCLNFLTLHSPFLMFCSKFRTSPLDIRKYGQLLTINLPSSPPPLIMPSLSNTSSRRNPNQSNTPAIYPRAYTGGGKGAVPHPRPLKEGGGVFPPRNQSFHTFQIVN